MTRIKPVNEQRPPEHRRMGREPTQPLVSMLIPSFNHELYVQACIESIIAQDYRNIELIIIDDGSTDDSVQKIQHLVPSCNGRFARFEFRSRSNKGLANTINEALEWCRGDFFATIASDDCLYANKTSFLLENFDDDKSLAGVFGGCDLIDKSGIVIRRVRPSLQYYEFDDVILRKHTIMASTQMLLLTKNDYKLKVIPEPLAKYRQHDLNISTNAWKMYEARKSILYAYKEHRFYDIAMAKISVMAAIDYSWISKSDSSRLLYEALSYGPKILTSYYFYYGLARLLLPSSLVFYLKNANNWRHSKID